MIVSNQKVLLKYLGIIIVMMLLCGGAMFAFAKHRQHTFYEARRSMVISHPIHQERNENANNGFNSNDQDMMITYKKISEDAEISQAARKFLPRSLRKQYSVEDLNRMVNSSVSQQSLVLTMDVRARDSKSAFTIVNAMSRAMKEELPSIQPGAGNVRLLEPATKSNTSKVTVPHLKKYVAVGLAVGGMLGLVICFVSETWRRLI